MTSVLSMANIIKKKKNRSQNTFDEEIALK